MSLKTSKSRGWKIPIHFPFNFWSKSSSSSNSSVKRRRTEEVLPTVNSDTSKSTTSTTQNEQRVLHEIVEMPDDDSDICEIVMVDGTLPSRREEKKPQHRGPQSYSTDANIFSRQAPQAGPSSRQIGVPPRAGYGPISARNKFAEALQKKVGSTLEQRDCNNLLELIENSQDDTIEPEVFRFSSSPKPAPEPQTQVSLTSPQAARRSTLPKLKNNVKMLPKNPNYETRWNGAGTSKIPRLPTPSASSDLGSKSPTKRRRVEQEADPDKMDEDKDDGPTVSSPFSIPSMTTTTQNTSKSTQPPSSSRSHTSMAPSPHSSQIPVPRSRLTPSFAKYSTAPHAPSPLRAQVLPDSPSSTKSDEQKASPKNSTTTSITAAYLSDLVSKTVAPTKPDVSNPYQDASPVKIDLRREKRKVSGGIPKAAKAKDNERGVEAEKDKVAMDLDNLSEKAKIEATIPKGIKSSRPSSNFGLPNRPSTSMNGTLLVANRTGGRDSYEDDITNQPATKKQRRATVEDADDDEVRTIPSSNLKAAKPFSFSSTNPQPKQPARRSTSVIIEEVTDDATSTSSTHTKPSEVIEPTDGTPAPAPTSVPSNTLKAPALLSPISIFGAKTATLGVKSSAPKEPSKLRETFVPDDDSSSEISSTTQQAAQPAPTIIPNLFVPKVNGINSASVKPQINGISSPSTLTPASVESATVDPKKAAMEIKESRLPKFSLNVPPTTLNMDPAHVTAREVVLSMRVADLPVHDLSKPIPQASTSKSTSTSTPTSSSTSAPLTFPASTTVTPPTATPVKAFDWAAAGVKPKALAGGGSWSCNACMFLNPASATEKCTVYGEKKVQPSSTAAPATKAPEMPSAPVKAFDWAAAGLKPEPTATSGASWTCNTCMLQNPASATEKCDVCDEPRKK